MLSKRRLLALAIFIVPWFFWVLSISSAVHGGFTENQWAVQMMVLGGAISMVAGAIAAMW